MKVAVALFLAIISVCLVLLVTGSRVLISERRTDSPTEALLSCTYFTGRGVTENVFAYSSNNVFGRDSCPFIYRP